MDTHRRWLRTIARGLAIGLGLIICTTICTTPALAQGVYSAALEGTIRTATAPLPGATVMLTNVATGNRWSARTNAGGRYSIENVPVGGPYLLEARAVGYAPGHQRGIRLQLGERFVADLTLESATTQLEAVQVTAKTSPLVDASRTGPSSTISELEVHSLPTVSRDFQGMLETSPFVSFSQGNLSIAGENNRFNNILIDGSVNNDLFGLASNGLPGGQINARAISLEAVEQVQLQVAPYDVRLGGFTGGLVNVVTKTGTNEFHGSLFEYFQNQSFVGSDIYGAHIGNFAQHQFGGSLGGPIIKNIAHFFLAIETRAYETPVLALGPNDAVNIPRLGYTAGEAQQIQQIMKNQYGVNIGSYGPQNLGNPNPMVFGKLDFQLAPGNTITLSENYVNGYQDFLDRNTVQQGGYAFSSGGYRIKDWNSTTRLDWAATAGRFSNDLIVAGTLIRDNRNPFGNFATISVGDSTHQGQYELGAEEFSQHNVLRQDEVELTDNLTVALGDHHVTVGTHDEFYHFHNEFFPQSYGQWSFSSVAALAAGNAREYQIALPLQPGGPVADFNSDQIGFYAEDQWTPVDRLQLTGGLRVDVPLFPDKPAVNTALLTQSGINTSSIPNGNVELSPRIGFNFDVLGDRSTIIRGGTGLFQGRPAYVWMSNAYTNTGVSQTLLTCRGAGNVPVFTPIEGQQPTACPLSGSSPIPTVNVFDTHYNFPQVWRTTLGFDRQLGDGFVFSLDGEYTLTEHQLYVYDQNIKVQGYLAGEGNRPIYGAEPTDPFQYYTQPTYLNPNFGSILTHINRNGDYSYAVTPHIDKSFGSWLLGRALQLHASYTYMQSYDRMSLSSDIASSNYQYNVFSGNATEFNRPLRPSDWSTPHQVKVSATNVFPLGFKLSMFYVGRSGTPYSYAVNGDVSGIGLGSFHDLVYVPKTIDDITLTDNQGNILSGAGKQAVWNQLNNYINSTSCLNEFRGRIMARNACRNPWQDIINARVAKEFTIHHQTLEVSWDILNLPNLLDRNWGLYKQVTGFEDADLLYTQGFDQANHRFAYQYTPVSKSVSTDFGTNVFEPSVWRMQIGARYTF